MSGAIMPEPLAMPEIRISPPSPCTAAAPLGKVSVVMMARAAISMACGVECGGQFAHAWR